MRRACGGVPAVRRGCPGALLLHVLRDRERVALGRRDGDTGEAKIALARLAQSDSGGAMDDFGLGWLCSWQDFRGWRTRDVREPQPPLRQTWFRERADAERECRLQRAAGMTACVSAQAPPKRRGNGPKSRLPMVAGTIPPSQRNPRERRFT